MSNSHWFHFLHDAFGVIRSLINFFSGGKVCFVVASGGGGGMCPFCPPWVRHWQLQRAETLGDPMGVSNTTETLEQKKTTSWTSMGQEQTSVQPQPTKYLALCWGYHRVWTPTHRRAIKEDSKVFNRDWVNHQACRLPQHIYIIAYTFISHKFS